MQNVQRIRFVAANFSVLQGLKAVPLGLLLIFTVLWANNQQGPASDLTLPILFGAGTIVLYWLISRYYRTRYGKVEGLSKQKWVEYAFGVAGGVFALAAFYLDTAYDLPFSCIGLLLALSFLAEYVRANLFVRGNYLLLPSIISFIVLLVVSILPLLGYDDWWQVLNLRGQLFGVLVAGGMVILVWGLVYHWFLIRLFSIERN